MNSTRRNERTWRAEESFRFPRSIFFGVGDLDEHVFQRGLQRRELFQLPALLFCQSEQRAFGVVIRYMQHAELRGGKLLDVADAGNAFQNTQRRRVAQADGEAGYAPV